MVVQLKNGARERINMCDLYSCIYSPFSDDLLGDFTTSFVKNFFVPDFVSPDVIDAMTFNS